VAVATPGGETVDSPTPNVVRDLLVPVGLLGKIIVDDTLELVANITHRVGFAQKLLEGSSVALLPVLLHLFLFLVLLFLLLNIGKGEQGRLAAARGARGSLEVHGVGIVRSKDGRSGLRATGSRALEVKRIDAGAVGQA
jgi:hypothetical protein